MSAGDLQGRRFGRWLVLQRMEDRLSPSGRRFRRWRCRCDCGRERSVLGVNLLNGSSRSCGCSRKGRQVPGERPVNNSYGEAMRRARERSGLSCRDLAKRSGIASGTIERYEANRQCPMLPSAAWLAEALGIGLDEYLGRGRPKAG